MTELDQAVARFTELNDESLETERMEGFYAKCAKLPIAYIEEALRRHRAESKELECRTIPDLMFSENRVSVETMDGVQVKIRSEINASMTGADIGAVYRWLDDRGYGAIVKKKHYLADEEVAEDLFAALADQGIELHADMEVNTNSLKKILKAHYEETSELPTELMKVSVFNHAVIKVKDKTNE